MLSTILFVLRIVLLGLWVGAMAGFAFLFAPTAFAHVGPTQAFAATIAASIRGLDLWGIALGTAAGLITVFASLDSMRTRVAIVVAVIVAFAASGFEVRAIIPEMETTPLLTPAYQSLHSQSSGVYSIVLLAALAALVLSCKRARSR